MVITDTHVFFYGSIFSQWGDAPFRDREGNNFFTAEHFMMYHKAKCFDDKEMMEKILKERSPKAVKAFGRQVKNFNKEKWEKIAMPVVILGNYLKFNNDKLRPQILEHKDRFFVEASPYDRIWGIGLAVNDDKIFDRRNWRGTNWLGESLDVAKSLIINEFSDIPGALRSTETSLFLLEQLLYSQKKA